MSCNSYNFNVIAGNSFLIYLNIQNSDGTYINLSGYFANGYVKSSYSTNIYLLNLNPQPISPFESGIIMIGGDATGTMNLPIGNFVYNVDIYNSSNYVAGVLKGDFNIYPNAAINDLYYYNTGNI